jgi:hypothetical protein
MKHLFKCAMGEYESDGSRWCFLCQRWIAKVFGLENCEGYREPACHHP